MNSNWKECKLGDLTWKITKGTTPANGQGFVSNGINYIKSESIGSDGRIDKSKFAFIDEETHGKLKRSWLQENDILFSMAGVYLGKSALVTNDMLPANTNQALAIIRINQEFALPTYVNYYLMQKSVVEYVNNMSGQSAQPNVNFQEIASISIPIPPLPEQRAIAGVLSSLDDKINLLHRQNKTLEGMAEALWRKMFVEEAGPGWETTTIGEVVTINGKSIDKEYAFAEIEYLDTGSLTEGRISEYQHLQLKDAPSRARRIVQKNDIVISMVRPIQKHYGILKKVNHNTIVSTGFVVITCIKIDPHFIYVLLTQKEMTEYLDIIAEASTTTYPSLVPSDIAKVDFQMPPTELLQQFSEYAEHVWDKIEENNSQIRTLSRLRDTLLPKLMSGEVRVGSKEGLL